MTWAMANDMDVHKQAHSAVLRLTGVARAVARELPTTYLTKGTVIDYQDGNGPIQVNGLGYPIYVLSTDFAHLMQETQITSLVEVENFTRLNAETIDGCLARWEIVTTRARGAAGYEISIPGQSWKLLQALRIPAELLVTILIPFNCFC